MVPKCGVCHNEDSKYKCPVCELRYCSLACYKTHKTHHEGETNDSSKQAVQPKRDRPGTKQRIPKVDFKGFENDPELQRILTRYPLLKVQLQAIYGLTLEPGPDEARSWNRAPLPGTSPPDQRSRGRGRGRSGRGFRGSRGGRGGWEPQQMPTDRQRGPWTQEKGDKEALEAMKKMRQGGKDCDEASEGLREFITLCGIRFGDKQEE